MSSDLVIAYVPALHEGYIRFFKSHKGADILIIDDSVIKELSIDMPYYGRDIRAISSVTMLELIKSLNFFKEADLFTGSKKDIKKSYKNIYMPDEDISRLITTKYLHGLNVTFESVFLRWDKQISTTELEVNPNRVWSLDATDKKKIEASFAESEKSSDWWRRIGAIIYKNGKVVVSAHNSHMPRPDNPNVLGDPRSNFNAGEAQGIFTSIHAEAGAIADAAKKGISLEGAHVYVSTFPCPNCARLIVRSGIKKVFYAKGYSLLDAEDILKTAGVEIVQVKI